MSTSSLKNQYPVVQYPAVSAVKAVENELGRRQKWAVGRAAVISECFNTDSTAAVSSKIDPEFKYEL